MKGRRSGLSHFWLSVFTTFGLLLGGIPGAATAAGGGGLFGNDVDWSYAGDLNLLVGQARLSSSDWDPVDEPMRLGVEIDFTNSLHWTGAVVGLAMARADETLGSGGDAVKIKAEFIEVNAGLRKVFYRWKYLRPFIGAGGSLFSVDIEREAASGGKDSDTDMGFGGYGEAGLYVDVYGPIHIGASVRYSTGRVDLFGTRKDPGAMTMSAVIGTHWVDY